MRDGRPKEPFVPWEGWVADIIGLYSEGASDVEIRGLIIEKLVNRKSLSHVLWERWLAEEEDFSETIKEGRQLSQVWWEKQGRVNLQNKEFSPTLWFMNVKNRFKDDWRDKQEVEMSGGLSLENKTEAELDAEIESLSQDIDE